MIKKNISSYLNLYFQEEMKFLQKEIYPYTTRMDHSTKKYRCMNYRKEKFNITYRSVVLERKL